MFSPFSLNSKKADNRGSSYAHLLPCQPDSVTTSAPSDTLDPCKLYRLYDIGPTFRPRRFSGPPHLSAIGTPGTHSLSRAASSQCCTTYHYTETSKVNIINNQQRRCKWVVNQSVATKLFEMKLCWQLRLRTVEGRTRTRANKTATKCLRVVSLLLHRL